MPFMPSLFFTQMPSYLTFANLTFDTLTSPWPMSWRIFTKSELSAAFRSWVRHRNQMGRRTDREVRLVADLLNKNIYIHCLWFGRQLWRPATCQYGKLCDSHEALRRHAARPTYSCSYTCSGPVDSSSHMYTDTACLRQHDMHIH